jgi:hypothetical protein
VTCCLKVRILSLEKCLRGVHCWATSSTNPQQPPTSIAVDELLMVVFSCQSTAEQYIQRDYELTDDNCPIFQSVAVQIQMSSSAVPGLDCIY